MRYLLQAELPFTLNYYRDHLNISPGQNLRFADHEMITSMRAAFQVIEEALPRYSLLGSLLDKTSAQSSHTHTCGVGRNYLVIDQHGAVAKCQAQIERHVTTIEHIDPLQVIREDKAGVQNLAVEENTAFCRSCHRIILDLVFVLVPHGESLESAAWPRPENYDRLAGGIYEPVLRTRCAKVVSTRGPRHPVRCSWGSLQARSPLLLVLGTHSRFATGCGPRTSNAGFAASTCL